MALTHLEQFLICLLLIISFIGWHGYQFFKSRNEWLELKISQEKRDEILRKEAKLVNSSDLSELVDKSNELLGSEIRRSGTDDHS